MAKAAPATITFRPKARTEYEVAADVVVSLLDGGYIKRDPEVLARIALHLDMPVNVLREAWRRRVDGKVFPLTPRATASDTAAGSAPSVEDLSEQARRETERDKTRARRAKQTVTPKQRANLTNHVSKRKAAKEPVEGMRLCSAPCHEGERLTPKTDFSVKDKDKGTLRAWCKPCMRAYVKNRYLSSKQIERLGEILHYVLGEGDLHVGRMCTDCGKPCQIGDEVVVPVRSIHHASCASSSIGEH